MRRGLAVQQHCLGGLVVPSRRRCLAHGLALWPSLVWMLSIGPKAHLHFKAQSQGHSSRTFWPEVSPVETETRSPSLCVLGFFFQPKQAHRHLLCPGSLPGNNRCSVSDC